MLLRTRGSGQALYEMAFGRQRRALKPQSRHPVVATPTSTIRLWQIQSMCAAVPMSQS
jgi:hypothetical protein